MFEWILVKLGDYKMIYKIFWNTQFMYGWEIYTTLLGVIVIKVDELIIICQFNS